MTPPVPPTPEFLALQAAVAGEYSLRRELGRGGMGVVYLARDVQLDRDVAIKVLPTHLAGAAASRERFLREARTAAGLSHPHVVPIHRVAEMGGFVFFVMAYVEGETLGERLRARGPLPPAEAARALREVAWALAYAHGRGIVHRDVKPDNILLEAASGRALVTDFGIAHGGAHAAPETDPGRVMGTAHFMSPEQAAGAPLDGRSDLYALGVVGYLAVSGRLPFEAASVPALLVRQATEAAPGVLRVAPGLPPALATAIDRCLARDPGDRFPDGEALAAALAPPPEARPALPPTLRAWLAARNPLLVPYMGWSAGFLALTAGNVYANVTGNPGSKWRDVLLLATVAAAPLVPIVGFHLNQARRQFRAGHTLADLRGAAEVERRERAESEALAHDAAEAATHRTLRLATVAAASWLAVTFALMVEGVIHENRVSIWWMLAPLLTTMLLGAVSNALDVQFVPRALRESWQTGIRDRLWNGPAGEWLARRLGAPERSRASDGAFRATEAALGLAAADLYAALPPAYRHQLAGLPQSRAELEARAAEARAEIELLAALAASAVGDSAQLSARRRGASAHLADSVAALESIRLDLLRLHADAGDRAPLTTLREAARLLGEDVGRLADARRETDGEAAPRALGAARD
ncbi:serine/threonine-protein kinase [Roseisolibacter sp. H3M3-2]|uniref:serine/threonine-protein kinase n=1 Tax=Roseisolibacter sp. H3M3-2 TaxID=3031323 RepID=UPI0023DA8B17|nr:serine/threonine-protein kinase [Roseisolibacter sp. H3M3-2]MDF1505200.1 serine/threonine-protein kinase [Roseisolibacter sp. H3M3-2]